MPTYLLAYRTSEHASGGSASAPESWNAYFTTLGSRIEDAGNPVFERSTLGNCGADTVLAGYSLVSADDLAQARQLATGCPLLADGGGVEVGEITVIAMAGGDGSAR
jgi:hypothetical protein